MATRSKAPGVVGLNRAKVEKVIGNQAGVKKADELRYWRKSSDGQKKGH